MSDKYDKDYPADYQPLDVLVARVMDGEIIEPITKDEDE
jgi:hypothetical protein|tara:strand:+ start:286 stop:402 length:117 start_codon:yes stop_codon:yes gene_type:complete